MSMPPRSMLAKVREDFANLTEAQRASTDVLLIEHLAQLVDTDPSVAAIKALREALARFAESQQPQNTNAVDEITQRRARRQSHAASESPARPEVRDHRR